MDKSSKETKRGSIRSFFNSCNAKNRSSTITIPHNTTDSLSHETVNMSSTSTNDEQQEEQISTGSLSLSPRLLSPLSNCSSSLNKPEESISTTLLESSMVLSPSSKRRQEQTSLSSPKSPRLSSPPSPQQKKLAMASISADKLRHEIQLILRDADLNTLSSKKVRQMLENIFKCDFTERKKEIDNLLMSEITTRDIVPMPPAAVEHIPMDNDIQCETLDDEQQPKKIESQLNNQQIEKSDEELAMEIHQQENRPSLRTTSASSTIYKKPTTPSLKIERRRTCYNKELDISDQLATIVGGHRMPRSEVVKRMWVYFKEHNLLDPINKQYINCDETLSKIFGRKRIRAFGMLKDLARHMSDPDKQQ